MSKYKYIGIIYKPECDDYCMGCRMGNFPAAMSVVEEHDESNLINSLCGALSFPVDMNDSDPEITVFRDGIRIIDENFAMWDEDEGDDEGQHLMKLFWDEFTSRNSAAKEAEKQKQLEKWRKDQEQKDRDEKALMYKLMEKHLDIA